VLTEERYVLGLEGLPLLGNVIFEEDGLDRTNLGADATIDALVGIDKILLGIVIRMDAINGADFNARRVLGADARLSDDVGHGSNSFTPHRGRVMSWAGPAGKKRSLVDDELAGFSSISMIEQASREEGDTFTGFWRQMGRAGCRFVHGAQTPSVYHRLQIPVVIEARSM